MRILYFIAIGVLFITSCNTNSQETIAKPEVLTEEPDNNIPAKHKVKVLEVVQTSSYSYLKVSEDSKDFWIAVGRIDAQIDDIYYYSAGLEMTNFHSKELDRVFETVYFVDGVSKTQTNDVTQSSYTSAKTNATELDDDINIESVEGGLTIAEIYKNGEKYADQKIIVRGKVVKVNMHIMDRNWIHIQDGTNDDGIYDLTITSQEVVEVGDIITFEGVVGINRKFGSGYSYGLIIENAVIR